jgi:hypothetical protein
MAFMAYWFGKSVLLFARLFGGFGYNKALVGKMIILAPADKMQLFLEGANFLKCVDLTMYRRLTVEHKFVCFYHTKYTRARDQFSITDYHLRWGKEGVAANFVMAVLAFDILESPMGFSLKMESGKTLAARLEIAQQYYAWLSEHSFPAGLVDYAHRNLEDRKRFSRRFDTV